MKHLREVLQAVSPRKRLRDLSIEEEALMNRLKQSFFQFFDIDFKVFGR